MPISWLDSRIKFVPKSTVERDRRVESQRSSCELTALLFRTVLLSVSGGVLVGGVFCLFFVDLAVPLWVGLIMLLSGSAGTSGAIFLNDQQLVAVVGGSLDRLIRDVLGNAISSLFG